MREHLDDEMRGILSAERDVKLRASLGLAGSLLLELVGSDAFPEYLTLPAYGILLKSETEVGHERR